MHKTRYLAIILLSASIIAAAVVVLVKRENALTNTERQNTSDCANREKNDLNRFKEKLPTALPRWIELWKQRHSQFSIDEFRCQETSAINGGVIGPYSGEQDGDPMLVHSPNGKMFVDLYSYHLMFEGERDKPIVSVLEPDTEVSIVDVSKNERKRLLFFGTDSGIDDAFWIDDKTVVVVGYQEKGSVGESGSPHYEPILWLFEIEENNVAFYSGKPVGSFDPLEYVTKKYAMLQ